MFRYIRPGAWAAVAAAVLLTGCGSDGSGDKTTGTDPTPSGTRSPSDAKGAALEGIWVGKSRTGSPLVLSIAGDNAALFGEHACTGTVSGAKGTFDLRCPDGNDDRSTGTATVADDGTTMTVRWGAGDSDVFKKSADGKLPKGLPTTLPSGLGGPSS